MPINNLNDGVGKKIVEALKMQSVEASDDNFITEDIEETPAENERYTQETVSQQANTGFYQNPETKFTQTQSFVDAAFSQSLAQNMMNGNKFNSFADDNYEYPANVAVLRQLIGKLPAGVSRQTGALIIKQTMEALGIPMNSVIQEAKQFQESLNTNSISSAFVSRPPIP